MKAGPIGALALTVLLLCGLPAVSLAAKPAPAWPSAQDLRRSQPGLRAADATCIARFYRGRLSRKAWFTEYYALTAAQKVVTDAGPAHCMTRRERVAMDERLYTALLGKHAELHCVALATEALTRAQRIAQTTRAKWILANDRIFRACRLTGALYAGIAKGAHLTLTAGERACSNRIGSTEPVLGSTQGTISKAHLKAVGRVFDRCVGRASEVALYRYVLRKFPFPPQIPCIARRAAATITFAELLVADSGVKTALQKATTACLSGSTTS
jgi:hypothetical protein